MVLLFKTAAAALSLLAVAPSVSAKNKNLRRKLQQGSDCMEVISTGSAAPTYFGGLAGPGTLITYGSVHSGCRDGALMQIDTGRGTGTRLSDLGMSPASIDVVMFTHMHSDHCDGFFSFMTDRFIRSATAGAGPVDVLCSDDAVSQPGGYTVSCREYITHIGDPYLNSGEVAQRNFELAGAATLEGPAALANVVTFAENRVSATPLWSTVDGSVTILGITTTHIAGAAAYRINTPVGSAVVGGDAGNDSSDVDTRPYSTSDQVELLATNGDVIVNTAIHPRLVEEGSMFNPVLYFRQSNVPDLGGMAARAGAQVLFLTHLTPSIGAANSAGAPVFGGPLSESDFVDAAVDAGFDGIVVAATDLATVHIDASGVASVTRQ